MMFNSVRFSAIPPPSVKPQVKFGTIPDNHVFKNGDKIEYDGDELKIVYEIKRIHNQGTDKYSSFWFEGFNPVQNRLVEGSEDFLYARQAMSLVNETAS